MTEDQKMDTVEGTEIPLPTGASDGSRGAAKDAAGDETTSFPFPPGEEKEEPEHRQRRKVAPRTMVSEQAGMPAEGDIDVDDRRIPLGESKRVDERDEFVAALKKHGSSAGAWYAMSSELEWTVEYVKVYAYSYFKELVRERNQETCHGLLVENDGVGNEKKAHLSAPTDNAISSWSFHELVLLDTLMVKHCKDLSCLNVRQESEGESSHFVRQRTVWERIAAQFAGRTMVECKKQGILRLLWVAHDDKRLKAQSDHF